MTLTYNNDNLPKDGSINKDELVKFIKRLRRKIEPIKISYYGCGEYGERFNRPHYHLLVFGYDFPDKTFLRMRDPKHGNRFSTATSYKLYNSQILSKLWKFGYHTLSEVTFQSARYCAGYIRKKINGKLALKHYNGLTPEFAVMSKRPAIGKRWLEKYITDVYPKDYFSIGGKKHSPPRYYDKLLQKWKWDWFMDVKLRREENYQRLNNPELMKKQKHKRLVTNSLERSFEIGR